MKRLTIILAATAVAGCGQSPADNQAAPAISVRSANMDAIHTMSEPSRQIALKRSIQDSNLVCKRVTATRFVGTYKNMDMWSATCGDRHEWALFVAPNDDVQVRLCHDTEAVGLPNCDGKGLANAAPPQ